VNDSVPNEISVRASKQASVALHAYRYMPHGQGSSRCGVSLDVLRRREKKKDQRHTVHSSARSLVVTHTHTHTHTHTRTHTNRHVALDVTTTTQTQTHLWRSVISAQRRDSRAVWKSSAHVPQRPVCVRCNNLTPHLCTLERLPRCATWCLHLNSRTTRGVHHSHHHRALRRVGRDGRRWEEVGDVVWVRGQVTTSRGNACRTTISSQLQFNSSFLLLVSRPSLFPMICLGVLCHVCHVCACVARGRAVPMLALSTTTDKCGHRGRECTRCTFLTFAPFARFSARCRRAISSNSSSLRACSCGNVEAHRRDRGAEMAVKPHRNLRMASFCLVRDTPQVNAF
jgi:hypothetical protein